MPLRKSEYNNIDMIGRIDEFYALGIKSRKL